MTDPSVWTVDRVQALAPDASSLSSGKGLATTRKWSGLGFDAASVWGECQGSGSKPYQTRIALDEPAFKCSCPSRKFPCKHGIGLFLLFVQERASFAEGAPPAWVSEWLAARGERQEKKAEKQAVQAARDADPEAAARRAAAREEKVAAGLEELRRWLEDLVRKGLAEARGQSFGHWKTMAARLVDAQAPALAGRVEALGGVAAGGPDWAGRLLAEAARLYLLIEAYERQDALPPELREEVRGLIGWTRRKEDLLQLPALSDRWQVLAEYQEDEGGLIVQRIWCRGQASGRSALMLNFAHPTSLSSLAFGFVPGTVVEAELCFVPAAVPLRAVVKSQGAAQPLTAPAGFPDLTAALAEFRAQRRRQPWLERWPMAVAGLLPVNRDGDWWLVDGNGEALPLHPRFRAYWQLLGLSGGRPLGVFGEYDGQRLLPLSAWDDRGFWPLGARKGDA